MPKTDFSIAPPSFVEFGYDGWPEDKKLELQRHVVRIDGVTSVGSAGGNSAIHVHYDSQVASRDALILTVAQIADEVLPGHNFST